MLLRLVKMKNLQKMLLIVEVVMVVQHITLLSSIIAPCNLGMLH